jgi:hypothetical protein
VLAAVASTLRSRSNPKSFGLGGGELLIRENTGTVELGELLELDYMIVFGGLILRGRPELGQRAPRRCSVSADSPSSTTWLR